MLQIIQAISLVILDNTQYLMLHKMSIMPSIMLLSKYPSNKNKLDMKQEYNSVPIIHKSMRLLSSFVVAQMILLALLHYFLNLHWVFPGAQKLRHA